MDIQKLLPENLEEIFSNLDSDGLWNAMKTSDEWFKIITNSTPLMRKLHVEVTKENFNEIIAMDFKIHHLTFKGFKIASSDDIRDYDDYDLDLDEISFKILLQNFVDFISKHSQSLEVLTFEKIKSQQIVTIFKTISKFPSLKKLTLNECIFYCNDEPKALPEGSFPNLLELSMTITDQNLLCSTEIFNCFKNVKSLKKVEVNDHKWGGFEAGASLMELLVNAPNIKHLSMDGTATVEFFDFNSYPFELHRLETLLLGFYWTYSETTPRLNFLQSQQGSLKHLRLLKLPYDYDGGVVLKFIIEEMNLNTFCYRDTPLIVNGRKCEDVEKIWFNEVQIKAGMEMMRQFPSIKNLEVWLCHTEIDENQTKSLLNPQTDIFMNVEELKVSDDSGRFNLVSCFSGLYKNCRNVKKFIINSTTEDLNEILGDVLPHTNQLEELHLSVEINEITKGIIGKSMKVQRLSVYFKEELCEILKRN